MKKKIRIVDYDDDDEEDETVREIKHLQTDLLQQCLCNVPESSLRKPFTSATVETSTGEYRTQVLAEWQSDRCLEFMSTLQLLFDIATRQNTRGIMCSRIKDIIESLSRNEHGIIDQMIDLSATEDKFVAFAARKALAMFFIVAKDSVDPVWLDRLTMTLVNSNSADQMLFHLDVLKRVMEYKDGTEHPTEDAENNTTSSHCVTVKIHNPERFDTTCIKAMCVKALEAQWTSIFYKFDMIMRSYSAQDESVVITFLNLWESIIAVKANLSVIDTKLFYSQLENMVIFLNGSLPRIIWSHLLALFNEVLCYGSTLALQDLDDLPNEPCTLAELVVRAVKERRILEALPYRHGVGQFGGGSGAGDRPLLQKMVLLVLKSVAIKIKTARSDSSDSSISSESEDFDADRAYVEHNVRSTLRSLDQRVKALMPYHPEMPLSQWVVKLFDDQDDFLIESMVCCLDVARSLFFQGPVYNELSSMLSPTLTFVQFIRTVCYDSNVLLDYLISSETCFLLYILKFLRYLRRNWIDFVHSCGRELGDIMRVMNDLRSSIDNMVSKALFLYDINPVLHLLEECCEFYFVGNVEN